MLPHNHAIYSERIAHSGSARFYQEGKPCNSPRVQKCMWLCGIYSLPHTSAKIKFYVENLIFHRFYVHIDRSSRHSTIDRAFFLRPGSQILPSVFPDSYAFAHSKKQEPAQRRILFRRLHYIDIGTEPDRRSAVRSAAEHRRIQGRLFLRQQFGDADQNHAFSVYAGAGRERYDPCDAVEIDRCGYERAAEYGPQIRPQLRRIAVQLIRFAG